MLPLPLQLLLLQFSLTSFVLGLTSASSTLRISVFPLIILCTWTCVSTSKLYMRRSAWAALVGGYSITYLLQYISAALLSGWSFDTPAIQPENSQVTHREGARLTNLQARSNLLARLNYGIAAASTFRHRTTNDTPPFNPVKDKDIPSRPVFLRHTALTVLACYLTLDIMGLGADTDANAKNFAPTRVPLLSRLHEASVGEVGMRILVTLGTAVAIFCSQEGLQSALAFLAVAAGLSEVEDWKPRFGSVADAYSIQRLWSRFWHQINRRLLADPTTFILQKVFKLQRLGNNGLLRYATLLLNFFISGLQHVMIDISAGIPWHASGALRFFCMQALGIMLERAVRACYLLVFPRSSSTDRPALWIRTIGYVWVAVFLSWTLPGWLYPMLCRTRSGMQDSILPFSLLAYLI